MVARDLTYSGESDRAGWSGMAIVQGMSSCSVCVVSPGAAFWPLVFGGAVATGSADECRVGFWPEVTVVPLVFPCVVAMLPSPTDRNVDSSKKGKKPLPNRGISV